jgi:TPR repeat protein
VNPWSVFASDASCNGKQDSLNHGFLETNDRQPPRTRQQIDDLLTSANGGDAQSEFLIGLFSGNGKCASIGLPRDEAKSAFWLDAASRQGFAPALYWRGMFMYSSFKKDDMVESLDYFERAAQLGNVDALLFLAQQYQTGNIVEMNPKKASDYSERAAQSGSPGECF